MKESELKTGRHNRPIQKSELKTKKQDQLMKESELKMETGSVDERIGT